ncbi:MAG: hypothetical protein ACK5X3_13545 [Pseudomonadota bacterium]
MIAFLALLDTLPGQVTLEVFCKKTGWSAQAMTAELVANAPLRDYFLTALKQGMKEAA